MTTFKRLPAQLVPVVAVLAGLSSLLAGVYLLAGLPVALIVGGVLATAVGLLVDV